MTRIAVIGLGKLGAPWLAVLADAGYKVIGVDLDPAKIEAINARRAPVVEPGLDGLLKGDAADLLATHDVAGAIAACDVCFLVLPTPSDTEGLFDCGAVVEAVREIGSAIRPLKARRLVCIVSTLTPGDMDGMVRPALEESSGRPIGASLGLCYNPAFVALGDVIAGFRSPDMVLIGEGDTQSGDELTAIHERICRGAPVMQRMSFINAELTKLAVNAFITTKISYANMLSEICDRIEGADAAVVASALGRDRRIGGQYLQPATGYGGPCFPRDNIAFGEVARRHGAGAEIADAADRINRRQAGRVVSKVRDLLASGTVAVLGMAFKAGTPVADESQGAAIADGLIRGGYRVLVADPMARSASLPCPSGPIAVRTDAAACVAQADLVVIATPWPEFTAIPAAAFDRAAGPLPIIDCWRQEGLRAFGEVIDIHYLGVGP